MRSYGFEYLKENCPRSESPSNACAGTTALPPAVAACHSATWSSSLFAYDTVKKKLAPKPGDEAKIRVPESLNAGAMAGISYTICTYPLELLKTRLTV